jgi:hypothetical protein
VSSPQALMPGYVGDFDQEPQLFDNVQCSSMLDLRELGSLLFPRLRQPDTESMPHSAIRKIASELLLGQSHATHSSGHNYDVAKLAGSSLDCEWPLRFPQLGDTDVD